MRKIKLCSIFCISTLLFTALMSSKLSAYTIRRTCRYEIHGRLDYWKFNPLKKASKTEPSAINEIAIERSTTYKWKVRKRANRLAVKRASRDAAKFSLQYFDLYNDNVSSVFGAGLVHKPSSAVQRRLREDLRRACRRMNEGPFGPFRPKFFSIHYTLKNKSDSECTFGVRRGQKSFGPLERQYFLCERGVLKRHEQLLNHTSGRRGNRL